MLKNSYSGFFVFSFFSVFLCAVFMSSSVCAKVFIVEIGEKSTIFVPEKVTVDVGDVVRWVNEDHAIPVHMFASVPGSSSSETPEIEIVTLGGGESWEHLFKRAGRYPYFCFIHKGMIGEVTVKEKKEK